ncbi:MAG: ATP-binding protein [Clostridia bacterium]|nr:ATP-binding protein [Clostridia bacterium]
MSENNVNKGFFFSSDFKATVKNYYYVDKSLLIKDFIDGHSQVSLITRPRRFGKSLNMDMMKTFFEKTKEDTSVYFKGLKIWDCGEKYTSEQGKYPVIYLDFKECKGESFISAMKSIKDMMSVEFSRHKELKKSRKIDRGHDLKMYKKIVEMTAESDELKNSLFLLSRMLYAHHKVKPVILIDEYDVPIQKGYESGYFSDMVSFMRDFLGAGLKGNNNLNFAVLTGVTRVSKESLFSGLNNIEVYSVLDGKYSRYYGFTKDEVIEMLKDFGAEDKFDEACDWYDGYIFGDTEVFNPKSVESYIDRGFAPDTYWANTTSAGELKTVLDNISDGEAENLELLASGKKIIAKINDNIPYDELWHGENVYTMLLSSGYLTKCVVDEDERMELGKGEHWLAIPNKEVTDVFRDEILKYADSRYGGAGDYSKKLLNAMRKADVTKLQSDLNEFMQKGMSVRNQKEDFYHGMVFGILGNLGGSYSMLSDREYGDGFADLTIDSFGYGLKPREKSQPSIVFEFEHCGKLEKTDADKMSPEEYEETKKRLMTKSAEAALEEIEKRGYAKELMKTRSRVLKYGIAFYGKEALVLLVECVDGRDVRKTSAERDLDLD